MRNTDSFLGIHACGLAHTIDTGVCSCGCDCCRGVCHAGEHPLPPDHIKLLCSTHYTAVEITDKVGISDPVFVHRNPRAMLEPAEATEEAPKSWADYIKSGEYVRDFRDIPGFHPEQEADDRAITTANGTNQAGTPALTDDPPAPSETEGGQSGAESEAKQGATDDNRGSAAAPVERQPDPPRAPPAPGASAQGSDPPQVIGRDAPVLDNRAPKRSGGK